MKKRVGAVIISLSLVVGVISTPAQAQEPARDASPSMEGGGSSRLGRYREDRWGLVPVLLRNPTDQAREMDVVVRFDTAPNLQFMRRAWVPGGSERSVLVPVVPTNVAPAAERLATQSYLLDRSSGSEIRLGPVTDGLLLAASSNSVRAQSLMISGKDDEASSTAATSLRLGKSMPQAQAYLTSEQLPTSRWGFHLTEWAVISEDQPDLSAAQLCAMRQWLVAGGHLWIMLDQVAPDFAAKLLGDDWTCTVVDYVDLPEVTIDSPGRSTTLAFDDPVRLARVLAPGMEVKHTVNGWPASMRRRVGEGWLIVTALGPRAWVSDEPMMKDGREQGRKPLEHLSDLGAWFPTQPALPMGLTESQQTTKMMVEQVPTQELVAHLIDYLDGQIGYRTLTRSVIWVTLGVYCCGLLCLGLILSRRGKLAHLGYQAPLFAVAMAGLLVGMGASRRQEVPLTVAQTQIVHVVPSQNLMLIDGALASYSPQALANPTLSGDNRTLLWPDLSGRTGEAVRVVATDDGRWHWEHLKLLATPRTDTFTRAMRLDEPVGATISFAAQEITGTLKAGVFGNLRDAVLATEQGASLVELRGEGLRAGHDNIAPIEGQTETQEGASSTRQFIAGVTLDDEQRSRQNVYRSLITRAGYPRQPTLFVWADLVDLNLDLPQGAQQRGAALLAVPVEIQRPAPGQKFTVPSAFVAIHSTPGAQGYGRTTQFTGSSWITNVKQGIKFALRFKLPDEVQPCRVESLRLTLDLDAAGRGFDVVAIHQDQVQPVGALQSPQDRVELIIPGDAAPLDADGSLMLGFSIGELPAHDPRAWSIRRMELEASCVAEQYDDAAVRGDGVSDE